MALQERAVGGVIDDSAFGAAAVVFQKLRIIVAGLEEVAAFPVADLVEGCPAVQENHQIICAFPIGKAEFITAVSIEIATKASSTVEIRGGEMYLQDTQV